MNVSIYISETQCTPNAIFFKSFLGHYALKNEKLFTLKLFRIALRLWDIVPL